MESAADWHGARALLEWQVEMGVMEAILDQPQDRFVPAPVTSPAAPAPRPQTKVVDPLAIAQASAAAADTLEDLREAMAAYEHCEIKRGARNLVFSDGVPGADVMLIGEAPGRDEDLQGRPFVGRVGQLLDKMLDAIDLSRTHNVYITNILPWRPPQNRDPSPEEIAMMLPFVLRHIELAAPRLLIISGNISAQALLGKRGITRLRGIWTEAAGLPALPILHPAYLLRQPAAKREAWADMLSLQARIRA